MREDGRVRSPDREGGRQRLTAGPPRGTRGAVPSQRALHAAQSFFACSETTCILFQRYSNFAHEEYVVTTQFTFTESSSQVRHCGVCFSKLISLGLCTAPVELALLLTPPDRRGC